MKRFLIIGFAGWLAATILVRIGGQFILHPENAVSIVILFAVSFATMAWLTRAVCGSAKLPREQWPTAGVMLILPALLLDPFTAAFFARVFPNVEASASGL
ncbi:MAG TPA: DUF5367 family protein, partial [Candidatus Binataceae bacterium]|nr:DUF5367 family protein [Candidatus Binataceae bacterium]